MMNVYMSSVSKPLLRTTALTLLILSCVPQLTFAMEGNEEKKEIGALSRFFGKKKKESTVKEESNNNSVNADTSKISWKDKGKEKVETIEDVPETSRRNKQVLDIPASIDLMPNEIVQEIFSFLSFEDLRKICPVSKRFQIMANKEMSNKEVNWNAAPPNVKKAYQDYFKKDSFFKKRYLPKHIPSLTEYIISADEVKNAQTQEFSQKVINSNVRIIDLSKLDLTSDDAINIVKNLSNTAVHTIKLSKKNKINAKDAEEIFKNLGPNMRNLSLAYNYGAPSTQYLNVDLELLDLSRNTTSNERISEIGNLHKKITELKLTNCGIDIHEATLLGRKLPENAIEILDLSNNGIMPSNIYWDTPSMIVELSKKVRELNLSHNRIDYYGAVLIARSLPEDSILEMIDLSYNKSPAYGGYAATTIFDNNGVIEFAKNYKGKKLTVKIERPVKFNNAQFDELQSVLEMTNPNITWIFN